MDVNSLSIYPEKFVDPKSRKITQAFVAALGILGLVLAFTVQPMFLPKENVGPADFRKLAWIASAIGLLLVIPTIPGHFEDKHLRQKNLAMLARKDESNEPKESFGKSIGRVIKNRNFMGKISIFFGYQLSALLIQSGAIYILLFVIGAKEGMLSVILGSMLGGALISIPFWLWGAQKGKTKIVCIIASIIMTLSFVPMFFAKTVITWIPCMFIFGVAIGGQWFIDPPLLTEVMEDITVKTGKKETSVVWGVQAFFTRFNSALQAVIFAVIHILTGFPEGVRDLVNLKAETWPNWELPVFGIQLHSIIIPFGIMIISTILFAFLYKLTPEKVIENRKKLQEMQLL